MFGGLVTIAGGTLASSGLIIARKPNAKQLIDKLVPYTGFIGVLLFVWGVLETLGCIRGISLLGAKPLTWIFWVCVAAADLAVGFLLGFSMISKYALSKSPAAVARGETMRLKLTKIQAPLGLFAIVMGVLYLVWLYVM